MQIYEHNVNTYNKVKEHFKKSNRTCIVQPTGTGKTYIAYQLIRDNKDKRFLFITSLNIIKEQVKVIMQTNGLNNIDYILYNSLSKAIKIIKEHNIHYDYIIIDEFHRAGAPIWYKRIVKLLKLSPNAKVLGMSATPIRYRESKNMCEVLFNNDIANEMTLQQAIESGILPKPNYIVGLISYQKELMRLVEKYKTSNINIKEADEKIEKAKRYVQNAIGIESIFKQNLKSTGKYVMFCKDFNSLDIIYDHCREWMKDINTDINLYVLSSEFKSKDSLSELKDFENDDSNALKVLLCIDMLNEGYHFNVDGVILMRPTSSLNIYFQEIGRGLSVSNNSATIIDIVGNIECLRDIGLDVVNNTGNIKHNNHKNNNVQRDSIIDAFNIEYYERELLEVLYDIDDIISVTNLQIWCENNGSYGQQVLNEWTGLCIDDNKQYTPEEVAKGTAKKFRWKCSKNPSHIWVAEVVHRTNGSGCPYCSGRKVSERNSLLAWCKSNGSYGQQLLQEWTGLCLDDNKQYTPDKIARATAKKFRWKCSKDPSHIWVTTVNSRTNGSGCPYCTKCGIQVTKENSLQTWCQSNGEFGQQLLQEWTGLCLDDNKQYRPDEVTKASGKRFRWQCYINPSHIWDVKVAGRTQGTGCPYCAGRKTQEHISLQTWCNSNGSYGQQLLKEWTGLCSDDNKQYTTDEVAKSSGKKFRWKCSKNPSHIWDASLNARTNGSGCPHCAKQRLSTENSLQTWCQSNGTYGQQLLKEWTGLCIDDNKQYTPEEVTKATTKKFRWQCSKDPSHIWDVKLNVRTRYKSGCPYCAGRKTQEHISLQTWCKSNDSYGQQLLQEWTGLCLDDNKQYTPEDVTRGASKKFRWKCSKDPSHIWDTTVASRTKGSGCPYCNRRGIKVTKENSLLTWCNSNGSYGQQLLQEWTGLCLDDNKQYTPEEVTKATAKEFRWKCYKDPSHIWDAQVASRTNGCGCPYCNRRGIKVTKENSLLTWCQNNGSFGQQLLQEWTGLCIDDNKQYTPEEITKASGKRFRWLCSKDPSHIWDTTAASRTSGHGCPYCAGQKVSTENSLQTWCNSNGSYGQQLLQEWTGLCIDDNKQYTPEEVPKATDKKFRWKCSINPSHIWDVKVAGRTQGRGCPYCAGRKTQERISLQTWCNSNETYGQQLLQEWTGLCIDDNKQYTPEEVTKASGKKFRWQCSINPSHIWDAKVCSRTNGSGCPYCRWTNKKF